MVVLHDINMAGRFCDEFIGFKGGCLLISGTSTERMQADTLAELYGIPMGLRAYPNGWQTVIVDATPGDGDQTIRVVRR